MTTRRVIDVLAIAGCILASIGLLLSLTGSVQWAVLAWTLAGSVLAVQALAYRRELRRMDDEATAMRRAIADHKRAIFIMGKKLEGAGE